MKNILVPTDFSDCALNALKFAADVAKKTGATIHLAHIYQRILSTNLSFNIELDAEIIANEQENFNTHIKELSEMDFLKGVTLKSGLVSVYKLWDILVMNKYHDIDMIVMGSNGVSGVEEFFVGSNSQKFIQMAECPVIVIKDEVGLNDIQSIVFASDFKKEVLPRFNVIKNFADMIDAKLHFLKIMTPNDYSIEEEEMDAIAQFAKTVGIEKEEIKLYQSLSVEEGIIEFCKKIKANMIAIETHGKEGLAHLFKDNITEGLTNHAIIPVFSVRVEEDQKKLTQSLVDFLTEKNLLFTKSDNYG